MQSDLQGLKITKGELKHLTGIHINDVYRPAIMQDAKKRADFISETLREVGYSFLIIFVPVTLIGAILNLPWFITILSALIAAVALRYKKFKDNSKKSLVDLLEDVDRYNAVIKAIDINDQLESVGNIGVGVQDREKVIEALKLTREDLVRALKTEKIIRENQSFIASNQEMFSSNLTAVKALQVSDRASEHGHLLNEALQIAISVKEEMRQLQKQR